MPKHRKGPPTPQLTDEYLVGATSTDLAAKYGMTHLAVIGRLRRAGVEIRPARRRSIIDRDDTATQIAAAYRSGESAIDIAKRLGIGRSTVARSLKRTGAYARRNGTRSRSIKIPDEPIKLGYLAGLFDGEGNLQFKTNRHANGAESTTGCKVSIYGTVPATMGWLIANVGGKARWDYKRQERKGWLPCGAWEIYRAQDVLAFLVAVEPMLLAKKKQAIKAIKFLRAKVHPDSPPTMTQ